MIEVSLDGLLHSCSQERDDVWPAVRRKLLQWNQVSITQLTVNTMETMAIEGGELRRFFVCYLTPVNGAGATPLLPECFESKKCAMDRCIELVGMYANLVLTTHTDEEVQVAARALATVEQARQYAIDNGLTTTTRWLAQVNKPDDMPSRPDVAYKVSWSEFIGRKSKFLPLTEARDLVMRLGIKTVSEYRLLGRNGLRPSGLPAGPQEYYGDEWRGWDYFLGKTT